MSTRRQRLGRGLAWKPHTFMSDTDRDTNTAADTDTCGM